MCRYITAAELSNKKQLFINWITYVQKELRTKGYRFSYRPIGSGKRNMVVKLCNSNYYDLDYQIIIEKIPNTYDWNGNVKDIKDDFREAFDNNKPKGFSCCEDSTQALQTKKLSIGFGYDIILTTYDNSGNFFILYNKKNTNNANNNDYSWMIRKNMNNYRNKLNKISGSEMWNYLREIYLDKRHKHKDDQENKIKAYQLLNEAVNETLIHFNVK